MAGSKALLIEFGILQEIGELCQMTTIYLPFEADDVYTGSRSDSAAEKVMTNIFIRNLSVRISDETWLRHVINFDVINLK